ncbi:hypothetical protein F5Y01DRAFT_310175 [Xylaria sp. FL0043]|nr:hypothetical protein F5Y01DRAFT_310175 [Xylaria sp. FL0043]
MEALQIFPGLEVADPRQHGRQPFVPPLSPQSQDVVSTEVPSYYCPPKYGEPLQIQDSSPAMISLPIAEATESGKSKSWMFIAAAAAAVTAIVVGAAVGGGLGSALSSCRKDLRSSRSAPATDLGQCTSATTTATQTTARSTNTASSTTSTCLASFRATTDGRLVDYGAVPSENVSSLSADCDALQKSWQVTSQGEKFSALCKVGFEAGTGRTDGNGNTVTLAEVSTLIAYSLSDCLEACSGYTYTSRHRGVEESCGSVVFRTNLADNYHANCLLLNSTVRHNPGGGACDECISATKVD